MLNRMLAKLYADAPPVLAAALTSEQMARKKAFRRFFVVFLFRQGAGGLLAAGGLLTLIGLANFWLSADPGGIWIMVSLTGFALTIASATIGWLCSPPTYEEQHPFAALEAGKTDLLLSMLAGDRHGEAFLSAVRAQRRAFTQRDFALAHAYRMDLAAWRELKAQKESDSQGRRPDLRGMA